MRAAPPPPSVHAIRVRSASHTERKMAVIGAATAATATDLVSTPRWPPSSTWRSRARVRVRRAAPRPPRSWARSPTCSAVRWRGRLDRERGGEESGAPRQTWLGTRRDGAGACAAAAADAGVTSAEGELVNSSARRRVCPQLGRRKVHCEKEKNRTRMNAISRTPAHTVTELASARQHQKPGRPSWSAQWRVRKNRTHIPDATRSASEYSAQPLEGGGPTQWCIKTKRGPSARPPQYHQRPTSKTTGHFH